MYQTMLVNSELEAGIANLKTVISYCRQNQVATTELAEMSGAPSLDISTQRHMSLKITMLWYNTCNMLTCDHVID